MNQTTTRIATLLDVDMLAPMFDAYRVFYEQESDLDAASAFLRERMKLGESTIILAEIENELVGFTQLYPIFSSVSIQRSLLLNDLYVVEKYRSQGIATRLLTESKKYAEILNFKGLSLATAIDNPAQKLYEREGWKKDDGFFHYLWNVS